MVKKEKEKVKKVFIMVLDKIVSLAPTYPHVR